MFDSTLHLMEGCSSLKLMTNVWTKSLKVSGDGVFRFNSLRRLHVASNYRRQKTVCMSNPTGEEMSDTSAPKLPSSEDNSSWLHRASVYVAGIAALIIAVTGLMVAIKDFREEAIKPVSPPPPYTPGPVPNPAPNPDLHVRVVTEQINAYSNSGGTTNKCFTPANGYYFKDWRLSKNIVGDGDVWFTTPPTSRQICVRADASRTREGRNSGAEGTLSVKEVPDAITRP